MIFQANSKMMTCRPVTNQNNKINNDRKTDELDNSETDKIDGNEMDKVESLQVTPHQWDFAQDKAKPGKMPYETPFILWCWARPVQVEETDDSEFEQVSVQRPRPILCCCLLTMMLPYVEAINCQVSIFCRDLLRLTWIWC